MIWIIALVFAVAVVLLGTFYLTEAIGRFEWLQKLSGGRKWPRRMMALGLIALGFAAVSLLDHEPTDYAREAETAADLVVSGHTHGGQIIPLGWVGEWFGGNDRSYGHEVRNGTDFIVTSGLSDWAMHFKTGTRSEYVMIDVCAESA